MTTPASYSSAAFLLSPLSSLSHFPSHRSLPKHPRRCFPRTPPRSRPVPILSCSASTRSTTATVRLQHFLDWFRGDFDNYFQVAAEKEAGLSYRKIHEHMHCRLAPVVNPKLAWPDETVIFATYYYNGNPQIVYRRRMYRIIDTGEDIEMRIYKMTHIHGLLVARANSDFSSIDLGNLDDTALYDYLEGAEVFWRYVEEQHPGSDIVCNGPHFIGYMHDGGWTSPESLRIEDSLVLTKEDLWVAEKVYNADGVMIGGNRDGIPHKMQRVRAGDEIKWTLDDTVPPVPIPE